MMQHGIAYEDVYNLDETGYTMGLIATTKVVTRAEMYGRRQVIQPGNRNGLHLLSVSTPWDGSCRHASPSKDQFICRAGIKTQSYHTTGGLKLVLLDGHQTKLDSSGFKRSSFLRLLAVQLENTAF